MEFVSNGPDYDIGVGCCLAALGKPASILVVLWARADLVRFSA